MTLELIIAAVIAALPTISAVVGIIIAVMKAIKANKTSADALLEAFQKTKDEITSTKEYESLKAQYEATQAQYITLLRAHRELLTKIDKIARKEADYEGKQTN